MGIFYKAVKTISKKVLITVGVLVFVACACIVVFSLFQYGVISFKEPKKIELDNLGSASELEGNVGIVSIFASDDYYNGTSAQPLTGKNVTAYSDIPL